MTKSTGKYVRRGTRTAWKAANEGTHFCQCGCGEPIPIRVEHFNEGIPKYRLGHNPQPRKALPERKPCHCGCGSLAGPGRTFVSGHNGRGAPLSAETRSKMSAAAAGEKNHRFGKRPPNYKGRTTHKDGYVLIHSPGHPFATKGHREVFEHRLVAEGYLREFDPEHPALVTIDGELYIGPGYEVHHVDGVKDHNVMTNLEVMTKAEHTRRHQQEKAAGG